MNKAYLASVLGLVVGDALGVPVEFKTREEIKKNPVTGMLGYGTHNQPAGTWSDDSSMVIATMDWLSEMKDGRPDYRCLMDKFCRWLAKGDYTPYQNVFDCGIATNQAIFKYCKGIEPLECGGKAEYDNGNGSLMRILPAALWCSENLAGEDMNGAEFIYQVSSVTHGHLRSKMGCLIYSKIVADLLHAEHRDKVEIVEKSLNSCRNYFERSQGEGAAFEKQTYARLWDLKEFVQLEEWAIKSSGYVVDTLEAAIWCFLNTDSYRDCVLKAVNLGNDTDTVGAVAGGLAGLYYGMEAIPEEWLNVIPKREWITELVNKML